MKPTVGRVVHYVSHGTPVREDGTQAFTKQCRAAIVTAVPELLSEGPNTGPDGYVPTVSLYVFNPTGFFFHEECRYDDEHEGGTWHWPEREDDA